MKWQGAVFLCVVSFLCILLSGCSELDGEKVKSVSTSQARLITIQKGKKRTTVAQNVQTLRDAKKEKRAHSSKLRRIQRALEKKRLERLELLKYRLRTQVSRLSQLQK